MEADRIPGLYFTGDRTFLDLAQEIKDHIYGFCTEELRLPAIERALQVCSEATIDHGPRLNVLLVSKQFKREYEKERERLEDSDCFERKLTLTYNIQFDKVFGRAKVTRAEDHTEDDDSDDEANEEEEGDGDGKGDEDKDEDEDEDAAEGREEYQHCNPSLQDHPESSMEALRTAKYLAKVTSLNLEYFEVACYSASIYDVPLLDLLFRSLLPRLKELCLSLIVPNWMFRAPTVSGPNVLDTRFERLLDCTKHVPIRRLLVQRHSFPNCHGADASKLDKRGTEEPLDPKLLEFVQSSGHVQTEYSKDLKEANGRLDIVSNDEFVEVPCTRTLPDLLAKCPDWRICPGNMMKTCVVRFRNEFAP